MELTVGYFLKTSWLLTYESNFLHWFAYLSLNKENECAHAEKNDYDLMSLFFHILKPLYCPPITRLFEDS